MANLEELPINPDFDKCPVDPPSLEESAWRKNLKKWKESGEIKMTVSYPKQQGESDGKS